MKKRPPKSRNRAGRPDRVPANEDRRRLRFSRELSVLYEDDALIVLDKPAGLLAVPIKGSATASALSLLDTQLRQKKQRAFVVHRIDRFASGALLFAKTSPDRDELVRQFLAHTPVRQYLAALRGCLKVEAGTLVHHFRRQGMYQQLRHARDPHATRAELRYSVERLLEDASLVRVELVTGLQNQIRAQFAAQGHPVIGDRKYHRTESSEQLIARVALHAAYLEFIHPRTGKAVSIDCRPPADFRHLVRELSRSSSTHGTGNAGRQDRHQETGSSAPRFNLRRNGIHRGSDRKGSKDGSTAANARTAKRKSRAPSSSGNPLSSSADAPQMVPAKYAAAAKAESRDYEKMDR